MMTTTSRLGWMVPGLAAALFCASLAHAEEQTLASQRWQTSMDAKGLARTNAGALLGHLDFDLGIWGNYEKNPVMLRDPRAGFIPLIGDSPLADRFSPSRRRYAALVG